MTDGNISSEIPPHDAQAEILEQSKRLFQRQEQLISAILDSQEAQEKSMVYLTTLPDGRIIDKDAADSIRFIWSGFGGEFIGAPLQRMSNTLPTKDDNPIDESARLTFGVKKNREGERQTEFHVTTTVDQKIIEFCGRALKQIERDEFYDPDSPDLQIATEYSLSELNIDKMTVVYLHTFTNIDPAEQLKSLGFDNFTIQNLDGDEKRIDILSKPTLRDCQLISGMLGYMEGMVASNLHPRSLEAQ